MESFNISTLTICGIAELPSHQERRVTHTLSLLDPGTPEIEALAAYGKHERMALWFHDIIEPEASDASAHGRYTP